jgi:hypothetical protein
MIDIIGYVGTILILVSFSMKDIRKLRLINIVSCLIFVIYGFLISSKPTIILNISVIILNLYFLIKKDKNYE